MLAVIIFLEVLAAVTTLALAIGLQQDYNSWTIETILLFTSALSSLVITFPTHFLTSSDDFEKSPRKNMYKLLAAFLQFAGFGLGVSAFVYGLATNVNGKCVIATHNSFCQVFRITLAFDTLLWLFQFWGFMVIVLGVARPPKPRDLGY